MHDNETVRSDSTSESRMVLGDVLRSRGEDCVVDALAGVDMAVWSPKAGR